jgi:hypothetical protein
MKNFRIGFKHPFPFLPNIAIFVIQVSEETGNKLVNWANTGKALLALENQNTVANYFVCEFRLDK